jgi:hypothetical protein
MNVEEITKLEGVYSLECMIMYNQYITQLSVHTGIPSGLNSVVGPIHHPVYTDRLVWEE